MKITFNEVFTWLFSNTEIPEHFLMNSTKLNSIIPYLPEQFWRYPELTKVLNSANDLHNIPDSIKLLESIQKIIQFRSLTKYDLWKYIPQRAADYVQKIQDAENIQEIDAKAKLKMIGLTGNSLPNYIRPAKQDVNNVENLNVVKEALEIEKELEFKKTQVAVNQDLYLKELNQEIIDELELTLFNVKLLKKRNQILFTLIDKFHKKRYFLKSFQAKIYVSKHPIIMQNDYLVQPDENFIEYIINDWGLLNKLRFAMNHNHKKAINMIGD